MYNINVTLLQENATGNARPLKLTMFNRLLSQKKALYIEHIL